MKPNGILTAPEAMALLGCSHRTITRIIKDGLIEAQKDNGRWVIDEVSCQKYAARYTNNKQPWRVPGERQPKSITINPTSSKRRRQPCGVGLNLAIRDIIKRRPELGEVIR